MQLDAALADLPPGPLLVACSGGLDSTALLHLLATRHAGRGLRAIHVDHGLHPDSARWSEHAQAQAARLGVALQIARVEVDRASGKGLEAAARAARYAAIERRMDAGEILVTAHHADDQAETVLLRLMRAAGVDALGGMRPLRRFGPGWLARPLLAVSRAALRGYAEAQGLQWMEDPANRDPAFDRSLIRNKVLPELAARWPRAAESIAASAALLRAAADAMDTQVSALLAEARGEDPRTLKSAALGALDDFLLGELIRAWLAELGFAPPGATILARVRGELLEARPDAEPCLAWGDVELRRHRDLVYALPAAADIDAAWGTDWDGRAALALPFGLGTLRLDAPHPLPLRVALRQGGERIEPGADRPSQSVKNALQELGVPPWLRARMPVLWHEDQVWAIGEVLVSGAFRQWLARHGRRYEWSR